MKKLHLLLVGILPILLILSGCETTSETKETVVEPVIVETPTAEVSQPVVAPEQPRIATRVAVVEPKHCKRHHHVAKHSKHKRKKCKRPKH